jgi:hypothetical protein
MNEKSCATCEYADAHGCPSRHGKACFAWEPKINPAIRPHDDPAGHVSCIVGLLIGQPHQQGVSRS